MRYLLDTNVWIHYLKAAVPVENRLRQTPAREIAVCSVVWAELLHGARKYGRREERMAKVERALSPFRFDDAAARRYAEIRDDLETRGAIIGPNDLLIAAIALANDLTLVTSDHEFSWVEGLRTEDWLAI